MADTVEQKKCKDCGKELPLSDFVYIKSRYRYTPRCRLCHNENYRLYVNGKPGLMEKNREYATKYHQDNREVGLAKRKENYKKQDRVKMLQKRREWYNENKERHAANRTKYEIENKDRLRAARRKWENERLATDVGYRLHKTLAGRIRDEMRGVRKKTQRTELLIGCTIEELIKFIESQFKEGMSWGNWSTNGWHIDHRIPVSWFNLENEGCKKLAFSYKNLQPLWSEDNLKKKNFYSHKMAL